MSPTVFRWKEYRFYFFSREEVRPHIHVYCAEGEAKFWIEPVVEVAKSHGLSEKRLSEIVAVVKEHKDEITIAWRKHFNA